MKDAEALAHLHRAAQLNRNNLHPREAEPDFREAVAADPANHFVHLAWGEILGRIGKDDEAIAEIRTALNLQPYLADAHLELGSVLVKNPTQHREALEQFQQGLTLAPSDPIAHYRYANALEVTGDKEGAAEQRKIADGLAGHPRGGGHVVSPRLISSPPPHYPQEAKAAHLEGTVRIDVLVGKDGAVKDFEVISGDPILTKAAVKAVRKWRYKPTLLNGQPVEVRT